MYKRHFDRVVWIKQEWAQQMSDGVYVGVVGKAKATVGDTGLEDADGNVVECLKTTIPLAYFKDDEIFREDAVQDFIEGTAAPLTLSVVTRPEPVTETSGKSCSAVESDVEMATATAVEDDADEPWLLDIDLDYFTTRNPFLQGLTTPDLENVVREAILRYENRLVDETNSEE